MRYSRLSASFIFIAEDTRAHTHTHLKERWKITHKDICVLTLYGEKKGKKKKSLRRSVVFVDITGAVLPIVHDGFFRQKLHPPSFSTQNKDQCDPTSHLPSPCVSVRLSFSLPAFFLLWIRRWLQKTDTLFGTGDLERIMSVERLFSLFFFFFFFNSFSRFIHYWNKRVSPLEKKKSRPERNKNKKEKKTPTFLSSCSNWIPNSLPPTNPPLFSSSLFGEVIVLAYVSPYIMQIVIEVEE